MDGACFGDPLSGTSPLFCKALEDVLNKLEKRIQSLKEKHPHYAEILDFYCKVRQRQERVKPSTKIESIPLKKEWTGLLKKEGFPLLQKQDFPLDLESSAQLFKSLCQVAKKANPFISEQTKRIEGILEEREVDLGPFLRDGLDEKKIEKIAEDFHVDKKVLAFLMQNSTKPSIEANRSNGSRSGRY